MPGSHAARSIDRAPRWCRTWDVCGTEHILLRCLVVPFCKGSDAEGRNIVHPLPLPLRGALDWCKGVVRCKKAKCLFLFYRRDPFHRAPTERIAQQQRKEKHNEATFPQCIPARLNNRRTAKRYAPYRTILKHRTSAGAPGSAIPARICTHEPLPPHQRGARSREHPA